MGEVIYGFFVIFVFLLPFGGLLRWLHRTLPHWIPTVVYVVLVSLSVRATLTRNEGHEWEIIGFAIVVYGELIASYFLWPKVGPVVCYPYFVVKGILKAAKKKTDALAELGNK